MARGAGVRAGAAAGAGPLQTNPADNPPTPAKIALGRRLFHDRRLARDGTLSCAVCHDPSRGFTNGRTIAFGVDGSAGRRNVATLVNRAYGASFFWDGRAESIEQQVMQPLLNPREMSTGERLKPWAR